MKVQDAAWLAGLLEGEGLFAFHSTPLVKLSMTDKDVVERAATLMGDCKVAVYQHVPGNKPAFLAAVYGQRALRIMSVVRPYMGIRRTQKIDEVLGAAASRRGKAKGERAGAAKLKDAYIPLLRYLYHHHHVPFRVLAEMCNISKEGMWCAVTRRTFKHIP